VWTSSGREIAAHIAAVPSNGHDSGRAECLDHINDKGLSEMTEVVGSLQYIKVEFSSGLRDSDLAPSALVTPETNGYRAVRTTIFSLSQSATTGSP